MRFDYHPCPVCGSHFHEDDDIVVCPVCGTPHHRSCWMENGHCVNEGKHAEGYKWDNRIPVGPQDDDEPQEAAPRDDVVICHICASENPADISHCGHCGAMLHPDESESPTTKCIYCGTENPGDHTYCNQCGAPLTPYVKERAEAFRNITGVDENRVIAGHSAAEYALYVRHGAAKYLGWFMRFDYGKVFSFNWAGLFFGIIWLFSRKIYKQALIIMLLLSSVSLIVSASSGIRAAQEILAPYMNEFYNGTISQETLNAIMPQFIEAIKIPFIISAASIILANVVCALFGNRWYFGKIKRDLDNLSENMTDPGMKAMYLSRRGGLSILSGICGYFIFSFIRQLFFSVAQFFAER